MSRNTDEACQNRNLDQWQIKSLDFFVILHFGFDFYKKGIFMGFFLFLLYKI